MILPLFYVWQYIFKVGPQGLGLLRGVLAFSEVFLNLFSGKLSLHYSLPHLAALGLAILSLGTFLMSIAMQYSILFFSCIIQGFGLALIIPSLTSLNIDFSSKVRRGRELSLFAASTELGLFFGSLFGLIFSRNNFFNIPGWRLLIFILACLQGLTSLYLFFNAPTPPNKATITPFQWDGFANFFSLSAFKKIWESKPLLLLFAAEASAFVVWGSFAFLILYLQTIGFSLGQVIVLTIVFYVSNMVGFILGGVLGDHVALKSHLQGRINISLASLACSIVLGYVFYTYIPLDPSSFWAFMVNSVIWGILGRAVNNGTIISRNRRPNGQF